MASESSFDAIVVGGGPAGAAAAIGLVRAGLAVAILERSTYERPRIGETVPAALRPELEGLGVWDAFAAGDHLPTRGACSLWGSDEPVFRDALTSPGGGGWHLDRRAFDRSLAAAAQRAGSVLRCGTRVVGLRKAGRGRRWSLALAGETETGSLAADWLVDASGRGAVVARWMGSRRLSFDRLAAASAIFAAPAGGAEELHTLVEAAAEGWWYAARLPRGRLVACWMSDADLLRARGWLELGPWRQELARTREVRRLVAGGEAISAIELKSAASHCLREMTGDGWIAAGDAACAVDPLASAGIVRALRSGAEAAAAVVATGAGDRCAFAAYARRVHQRFDRYLLERRAVYGRERRWPGSVFWRRRWG